MNIKECRVCGKEYNACSNSRRKDGAYNWREVACCPEHGEIYLQQVLEARGLAPKKEQAVEVVTESKASVKKQSKKVKSAKAFGAVAEGEHEEPGV